MKKSPPKSGDFYSQDEIVEFYIQNYQNLLKYSYSISKRKSVSEDVLQDVFISIFKRDKIEVRKLDEYLTRAVKFNTFKKMKARTFSSLNYQCELDLCSFSRNTTNHYDFLAEKIILEEIEKLPKQRKLIFKMKRLERYSTKKVSKQLDISKKTVENHLTLAVRQLKPKLIHLYVE